MFKTFNPSRSNFPSDMRDSTSDGEFGELPEWNLDDLYPSTDGTEITQDMDWLSKECPAFATDYEGKLADLDATGLLNCILRFEKIQNIMGRVMSFAGLRYYQNTVDADRAKFMADMQGAITDMSTPMVFFSLELNRVDDAQLDAMVAADEGLARYKPILDQMRAMKPYQLNDVAAKLAPLIGANSHIVSVLAGTELEILLSLIHI